MEGFLIVIVLALAGVIAFLLYKLSLQKHYYAYKSDLLDNVEESSSQKIKGLEESVESLNKAAYTDITTKIGNRDYFIKTAVERFSRAEQGGYTMIVFGISNIAVVNRMFGPSEGDRLVRYVAQRLKERSGQGNVYAIVQSNLFALLMKGQEDARILEWIDGISREIGSCSDLLKIELRFGIYKVTNNSEKISEMLSRTILAQRSIPGDSKENYYFFNEELQQEYEENRRMCQEMEAALDAKKFVMYLQPMMDLHFYRIHSAEALVRWEHETKGLLSPYAFLPVFENTNLMLKLDYYMWDEACKTIRRWIDNKMEPLPLMVNISPVHLNNIGFMQVLSGLLEQYKLPKNSLVLELPERALVGGGTDVMRTVREIADMGFVISIDNFGGQHSPVNLLRDLPVSMVKLDRKFLTENSRNEDGKTILRYLIAMAKELDLQVVVEGVETQEQVDFLTEIGCDIAQGYFFSKPVNLRDFDNLNQKIIRQGYLHNQYYPTFTDLDNGVDIMGKMMGDV